MAERRGICDERKAPGEAVRGVGGISGYTALREKGRPWKGENLLAGEAFLQKSALGVGMVWVGRWGCGDAIWKILEKIIVFIL